MNLEHIEASRVQAILQQVSPDDGFLPENIAAMLRFLQPVVQATGQHILPIEVDGDNATAFGFMLFEPADRVLDFRTGPESAFAKAVAEVLNDTSKESPDGLYDFAGITTLLTY